jgi:hypothetical protein
MRKLLEISITSNNLLYKDIGSRSILLGRRSLAFSTKTQGTSSFSAFSSVSALSTDWKQSAQRPITPMSSPTNTQRSAFLLIDIQDGLLHPSHWGPARNNPSFENNAKSILNTYRSLISSTTSSESSPHKIIHIAHFSLFPGLTSCPLIPRIQISIICHAPTLRTCHSQKRQLRFHRH